MLKCKICEDSSESMFNLIKHYNRAHNLRTTTKKDQPIFKESYSEVYGESPYTCKMDGCTNKTMYRGFEDNKTDKGYCTNFCIDHFRGVSYQHLLIKYGKDSADIKWKAYREKQANTNSFEYKKEKFGWTYEQFEEYNKSRAVTLENMIARHGEDVGTIKFQEYCKLQSYAGSSLQYFIDNYGELEGTLRYNELNKKKGITVENLSKKYGEETAKEMYIKHVNSRKVLYSNDSQELFNSIKNMFPNYTHYYATNNKEFGKYNDVLKKYYFYDYCLLDKKLIIEFNGLKFHCKEGHELNWQNPYDKNLSADQAKLNDKQKSDFIKSLGFTILEIWEDDYNADKQKVINSIKDIIDGLSSN